MFVSLFYFLQLATSTPKYATCYFESGNPVIVDKIDKEKGVAWATFDDTIDQVGTSHIVIETTAESEPTSLQKTYCAGYVDGYLMQERIFNRWMLQKDILGVNRTDAFDKKWTDWMEKNIEFTKNSIKENGESPYWKSVALILSQLDGLVDGYKRRVEKEAKAGQDMTYMDFWILQSIGDIYDLQPYWDAKAVVDPFKFMECTALVTILPDYSDVFFGHDTWSDYRKMSNTVKEYIFHVEEWSATRVEVSTKIGAIPSSEDFWITSNGLLIFETTIGNQNSTLKQQISEKTLLTWIRNYHASWVANTGEQWADEFLTLNSGTYNNQYVIVDSKVLSPGKKPEKNLIWVTETMPTIGVKGDVTQYLADNLYFPSFNVPYFPEIRKIANYTEDDYYKSSRYLILQRDAPGVATLDDFKHVMRYNSKDEPIDSDSGYQIFARYDMSEKKQRAFGGLDTKVTTALTALQTMGFDGIWSPQYENYTAWDFESEENIKKFGHISHDGLPAHWEFPWTNYSGESYSRCNFTDKNKCINTEACGWCTYDAICLTGNKDGPYGYKCQAGWKVKVEDKPWSTPVIASVTAVSFIFCAIIYIYNIYDNQKKKNEQKQYSQI